MVGKLNATPIAPVLGNLFRGVGVFGVEMKRGDSSRFAHPGFVDMAGKVCGGWTVLERVANVSGNYCWRVRHNCADGAVEVIEGIRLRAQPPKHCANCRPKRPGTVARRVRA